MNKRRKRAPRCIIIAGPNGAGKTTFAQEFLPKYAKVVHFVNADLIAGGLSPLSPESAAIAAGRLFLKELDRLAARHADFAFESTLSGLGYVSRLKLLKAAGYRIEIIYLTFPRPELPSAELHCVFSRVGIAFQKRTRFADFEGAGKTSKGFINRLPTPG